MALSPLRVIAITGPSVAETIVDLPAYGIADGYVNAITPTFHWHLALDRLGHVTSREEVHARSGRRVLFLELRERAEAEPFLSVYLHRGKGEEFSEERARRFAALHAALSLGRDLEAAP